MTTQSISQSRPEYLTFYVGGLISYIFIDFHAQGGIRPAIPASERAQIHDLEHVAIGISSYFLS